MPAISVGSVEVDVVPSAQGIEGRLRAALVPPASKIADEVGRIIGRQIALQIAPAVRDGIQNGAKAATPAATRGGDEAGGAFARSLKARLEAAFRSMPKLDVRLSDTGVDADLARLRAKLESLSGKTIGIDIDAATARAQAADIEERLRRLGAAHPNIAVRADTAAAIAQLQALRAQIDELSADPARIRVETDGQLGTRLRAAVAQAEASLPNINIGADTTPAEVEIARLRAQLTSLSDARVGIDIDAATALARITEIQTRLARLSTQTPNVAVRVDTAAAAAQLAAFQAQVNRLDGQTARVDVDTSSAVSGMYVLVTAAIAFGPAILPVLPVVAAGLGAIAAAAVAAGVGIGSIALVAVPAFKQIGTVLQAQKAAQTAATSATNSGAQAASQAASKALQLAGAQQALATAERNGANQIAAAQRQVTQAKQAVADAITQAAQRTKQADQQVEQAEASLAQAQVAAKQAQLDLVAARQEATRQLQDMNNQLVDSQLAQRDATLQVQSAQQNLNQVNAAGSKATVLQRAQAQLQYDEAVQHLKEQQLATKRQVADTDAANKAGVKGSATYKSAQDKVAQAQQNVAAQTKALKDAQTNQAQVAVQNARSIADAQAKVADAERNVATAQQSAADAIASAQRQIQSASMSTAGGVNQAAVAQAKYRAELAKLTPAARQTLSAFLDLRSAFGAWSEALQPAVMPIFTRAIIGLKNSLPGLTPFVLQAATAIKGLQDRASAGFKSPWWKTFKTDLETSITPALTGLGVAVGSIFQGMVGIIDAFLPHMDGISSRLQGITGRFATWGKSLKGSPQFEQFLSFASDKAPILGDALRKIASAFLQVGEALSPLSGPLLQLLGGLANAIAIVADHAPWMIQLIYGIIVATRLWAIAQTILNFVMSANPLVLIGLAILALVGFVIYAYNRFGWFRTAVQGTWHGIQVAASAVVDWFKGPFVNFFTKTIPGAFNTTLSWVKHNWPWILGALTGPIGIAVVYVVKHWNQISAGISAAWGTIKRNVLNPISNFFTKTIPGAAAHLRDKVVGAFNDAKDGVKIAWDKLHDITRKPVQFIIDTVYNNGIRKVWNLVTDAFGGKHLGVMKFATGGITPGYTPGRDVHRYVSPTGGMLDLSGGEAIMRPEWTRAVGPGYVGAMNAAARAGGVGGVQQALGFKDGGIFGGIGDALSGAWDKIKKGASWLKDTFSGAVKAGVTHVVNPLINAIPGGNIGFVGLLKDLMKSAIAKLVGAGKKGDSLASPKVNYKPSAGVEQWRPVVLKALDEVHQSRGLAQSTLRRMNQESGGNPKAVNLWDSNAKAGYPSTGLMQVIRPTFQHYAGKYKKTGPFMYGVSINPMANIFSSMKYALGAYGSLSRAYDRAGGYDAGGYLQPGLNLAYNGTGRPEPVFTSAQAGALTKLAASRATAGQIGDLQVSVYVGDQQITDIARTEVRTAQGELIQVLNAN